MAAPHPRSPFEQLGPDFVRIHCAGIVRALASVLDCLAGAIVGVAAVWLLIGTSGFGILFALTTGTGFALASAVRSNYARRQKARASWNASTSGV